MLFGLLSCALAHPGALDFGATATSPSHTSVSSKASTTLVHELSFSKIGDDLTAGFADWSEQLKVIATEESVSADISSSADSGPSSITALRKFKRDIYPFANSSVKVQDSSTLSRASSSTGCTPLIHDASTYSFSTSPGLSKPLASSSSFSRDSSTSARVLPSSTISSSSIKSSLSQTKVSGESRKKSSIECTPLIPRKSGSGSSKRSGVPGSVAPDFASTTPSNLVSVSAPKSSRLTNIASSQTIVRSQKSGIDAVSTTKCTPLIPQRSASDISKASGPPAPSSILLSTSAPYYTHKSSFTPFQTSARSQNGGGIDTTSTTKCTPLIPQDSTSGSGKLSKPSELFSKSARVSNISPSGQIYPISYQSSARSQISEAGTTSNTKCTPLVPQRSASDSKKFSGVSRSIEPIFASTSSTKSVSISARTSSRRADSASLQTMPRSQKSDIDAASTTKCTPLISQDLVSKSAVLSQSIGSQKLSVLSSTFVVLATTKKPASFSGSSGEITLTKPLSRTSTTTKCTPLVSQPPDGTSFVSRTKTGSKQASSTALGESAKPTQYFSGTCSTVPLSSKTIMTSGENTREMTVTASSITESVSKVSSVPVQTSSLSLKIESLSNHNSLVPSNPMMSFSGLVNSPSAPTSNTLLKTTVLSGYSVGQASTGLTEGTKPVDSFTSKTLISETVMASQWRSNEHLSLPATAGINVSVRASAFQITNEFTSTVTQSCSESDSLHTPIMPTSLSPVSNSVITSEIGNLVHSSKAPNYLASSMESHNSKTGINTPISEVSTGNNNFHSSKLTQKSSQHSTTTTMQPTTTNINTQSSLSLANKGARSYWSLSAGLVSIMCLLL